MGQSEDAFDFFQPDELVSEPAESTAVPTYKPVSDTSGSTAVRASSPGPVLPTGAFPLLLAVCAALLVGVVIFNMFAAVRITGGTVSGIGFWLGFFGVTVLLVTLTVVLSLVSLVRHRKLLPAVALVCSIGLPIAAASLGGGLGIEAMRLNLGSDLALLASAAGPLAEFITGLVGMLG